MLMSISFRFCSFPSALVMIVLMSGGSRAQESAVMKSARPVWPAGLETEMNLTGGFRAVFQGKPGENVVFRVAASTLYRAWLNGQFLASGPARAAHEFYRVDQWELGDRLVDGDNLLAVEVVGYNINSFALLDQPSFLQAEVLRDDQVLVSTAGEGCVFEAAILPERVRKVRRFSFQRSFIEVYRLQPGYDRWRREVSSEWTPLETALAPPRKLLTRGVLYPDFTLKTPVRHVSRGRLEKRTEVATLWKGRALLNIGPNYKGYREDQLEATPSIEIQKVVSIPAATLDPASQQTPAVRLVGPSYQILDLGENLTGMPGATITCHKKTRLLLLFDELLLDDDVNFKRQGSNANIISYEMEPGTYHVEAIEPYTMRYLKWTCLEGDCEVENTYLRQYIHPEMNQAHFAASDDRLNRLFAAGVSTNRQNVLDLFMDCPLRERAGWLCDSFFTARATADLTGETLVERNFFENFMLPDKFPNQPDGALIDAYPADRYNHYITHTMWFAIQLEEYATRSGDSEMVDRLRAKVTGLLEYLSQFENDDGLLENPDGSLFVGYAANKFIRDVSYPANMIYAGMLDAADRMYGLPEARAKAESIGEVIRRQSFDGEFFVDSAIRNDGKLERGNQRSEACQYYAFFFDVATRESHPGLWQVLCDEFGPQRTETKAFPEIPIAEPFLGKMLRIEMLSEAGRCQQIADELIPCWLYMVDRTGTLWEFARPIASCCHGYPTHICRTLFRDVLGIYRLNIPDKQVDFRLGDLQLDWCQGQMPTPDGPVKLHWWQEGDRLVYELSVPAGYEVRIENQSGKQLLQKP